MSMISPVDYRKLEDLTVGDVELLKQAYARLIAEGYHPGYSFADFLDIVLGRGEHQFNEFREMDLLQTLDDWLIDGKYDQPKPRRRKIEVIHYER